MTVVLTGASLTLAELVRVARGYEPAELGEEVPARARAAREVVERALARGEEVYGLTTGVGVRKRARIADADRAAFDRRLLREHRVGQGGAAPGDVVRAQLLLAVNQLAGGTAGVRLELVEHLLAALNEDRLPVVRMLGSLGMSDLPQNADLADGVVGDFELAPKEGLALLGHGGFSTGFAALALYDAGGLLDALDVAAALDLEALAGNVGPLHDASRFRGLLAGSYLWDDGAARELQDPLSFRCVSQVHGAARETLELARARVERALNDPQGNPRVLVEEDRLVSVGDFDLVAVAQAVDFVRIALAAVLTSAGERAVKLLQAPLTGLPEGLAAEPGLAECALSELGVPAQALAAEAALLAQPVSVATASTSHHEGIEDRVTLAPLAARRLAEQVELGERLAAVELTIAAQAVDLRGRPRLGAATGRAYAAVRGVVAFTGKGDVPPQDLEPVAALVRDRTLF